jgi:putative glutamine amidotransferase
VLNVALGGTLIQDTNTQVDKPLKHRQDAPASYGTHTVKIKEGSRLNIIFCKSSVVTNSFHHQAVKALGEGLEAPGWAADGVIEAYEAETEQFVVGVQWHPEHMSEGEMGKLFSYFVAHCPCESRPR